MQLCRPLQSKLIWIGFLCLFLDPIYSNVLCFPIVLESRMVDDYRPWSFPWTSMEQLSDMKVEQTSSDIKQQKLTPDLISWLLDNVPQQERLSKRISTPYNVTTAFGITMLRGWRPQRWG
ncbi:hypothetical protein CRM22_004471 [Opisthorchis felineus]|uniref:Uncharacterized protein n=1 Tax=Opisthorchis felineus TaxID=147828 RepID=A0A4S2LW23_OPIFE|nr:hypothetical protein CRM22_004471 [Opisthorchis felineus]